MPISLNRITFASKILGGGLLACALAMTPLSAQPHRPGGHPGRPGHHRPHPSPQWGTIVLYSAPHYRGNFRTFRGSTNSLARTGWDNRARSVRVNGRWGLCEFINFRGRCVTVTRSVPNLSSIGMAHRISSLRQR